MTNKHIFIGLRVSQSSNITLQTPRATRVPIIKRKHDDIAVVPNKQVTSKLDVGTRQQDFTPCKRRPVEAKSEDIEFQVDSASLNSILKNEPISASATPRRATLLHTPGRTVTVCFLIFYCCLIMYRLRMTPNVLLYMVGQCVCLLRARVLNHFHSILRCALQLPRYLIVLYSSAFRCSMLT